MFYDEKFMSSESFGKVWRAAYNRNIESSSETCLPKICRKLDRLIDKEENNTRKRLSLRTSAVLIDGTAKLYKQEMQRLYEGVIKLEYDLIHHRKRRASTDNEDPPEPSKTTGSSNSIQTPEKIMRHSDKNADSLNYSLTTIQNRSSSETEPRQSSQSIVGLNRQTKSRRQNTNSQPKFSEDSVDLSLHINEVTENDKSESNTSRNVKRNQETQTSISFSTDRRERDSHTSDREPNGLPFGFFLMFDNDGSRYPSKILCTSLNKNVRNML